MLPYHALLSPSACHPWRPATLGLLFAACWLAAEGRSAEGPFAESQSAEGGPNKAAGVRVYIGTYTRGDSQGIYQMRLDLRTGALSEPVLAGKATNPSFVVLHPERDLLYAAGEVGEFEGQRSGAVNAFRVDPDSGQLTFLNAQPSGGGGTCHVSLDRTGRYVLAANYGGGSVSVLPLNEDGSLGEPTAFVQHEGSSVDSRRQSVPHAHSINIDPTNRFAIVADLGLDKLLVYRFDPTRGTLAAHDPPSVSVAAGSGPRHFTFHPGGKLAYVINEMASTVTALRYDAARGSFEQLQTITTLPEGFDGNNSTAEVQVHPSGKFLYGSNRGHDSIAVFAIDPDSGRLQPVEHEPTQGKSPRNFGIDPSGQYMLAANQDSGSIVVLKIDPATGALTATGKQAAVDFPVCVRMK